MLGRVLSVELALFMLCMSLSAFLAGTLEDKTGMSPEGVCIIMACVGFFIFIGWGYAIFKFGGNNFGLLWYPR